MKAYLDILKLAWPLSLGMLNNAIMQFTDRAFLAHESMASLEAVVPASVLSFILCVFFQSVVAYSGTFVAHFHGAGDERKVRLSYRAGLLMALCSGLLIQLFILPGQWLLSFLGHAPEVMTREKIYFTIVLIGSICFFGQMSAQVYFTGIGKTRLIFFVNVLGNLLNCALDPIFIFGWWGFPRLGIAGAAYATVLAMGVQWLILGLLAAFHQQKVVLWRNSWRELGFLIKGILRFGVPAGGYAILNFLGFTIFVFLSGRMNDLAFAVSNACLSLSYLLFAPMEGFSLAATTLVAQAKGRGDVEAAAQMGRRSAQLSFIIFGCFSLFTLVFWRPILSLFISHVQTATRFYDLGFILVSLMVVWELFDAATVVFSGALKGAGDTRFVFWWMLIGLLCVWIPLATAISLFHPTMPMLWAGKVVYYAVLFIGVLMRWRRGAWHKIRIA